MKNTLLCVLFMAFATTAYSQEPTPKPQSWPIVLGPDDKPAFPPPPAGFDHERQGIPHGKFELVEYWSKTVGTRRKMLIYTPPGYSPGRPCNVLYLLHGIGGDENEWQKYCAPGPILDNLYADGKLEPMIVVFPNGRAQKQDHPPGDWMRYIPAFGVFTNDLLADIIPFIDTRYAVIHGGAHCALAGFSMGGGQSMNIGLTHTDQFEWVGGFSTAPNMRPLEQLIPSADAVKKLKLLYIACGNQDGLLALSQKINAYLKQKAIPHIWQVNDGAHNGETWKLDLYHFAPLLFKPALVKPALAK